MIRICGSCGREVYGDAANCQHCGAPQPDATPESASTASQVPKLSAADVRATPYASPKSNVAGGGSGGPKTTPGIVITGLVLSFIPLLCLNIVGAVLGIIGLSKINGDPQNLKGKGLAITSIVVGFGWTVLGIVAAIAIPAFVSYSAKSKQSEAKVHLKGIYVAQEAYRAEHGRYGTLEEIQWDPSGDNLRYTYILGDERIGDDALSDITGESVTSTVTPQGFRAVAIGNIDSDAAYDVWTIDHENSLEHIIDDIMESDPPLPAELEEDWE